MEWGEWRDGLGKHWVEQRVDVSGVIATTTNDVERREGSALTLQAMSGSAIVASSVEAGHCL